MRNLNDAEYKSKITQTPIDLRCIYLPKEFITKYDLKFQRRYQILIDDNNQSITNGTLQVTHLLGGLAKMYRAYELEIGDEVGLFYENGTIIVVPPEARIKKVENAAEAVVQPGTEEVQAIDPKITAIPIVAREKTVFARQNLKHLHIPEFAPANLTGWTPETETDVFLVFGMLTEYTDFRYCCGVSQNLIAKLGYVADTKPDAILIDRGTDEYMMAEFKVYASDFTSNHKLDDVDVLVCWIDDSMDKSKLPPRVVSLKDLREKAVKAGDIPLDELS